jgi:hypothetical protein
VLKELVKEISDDLMAGKAGTPVYCGPVTFRIPATIRNVQDWHIIPSVLGDAAKGCQKNCEAPFTEAIVPHLESLFEMALKLYRKRNEVPVLTTGSTA